MLTQIKKLQIMAVVDMGIILFTTMIAIAFFLLIAFLFMITINGFGQRLKDGERWTFGNSVAFVVFLSLTGMVFFLWYASIVTYKNTK